MEKAPAIVLLAALALASCAVRDKAPAGPTHSAAGDRLYAEGKQHLREGRLDQAVDILREARRADPQSVDVLNALGAAYDMMGRYDLAGGCYRAALVIAPRDPVTLNNLGWSNHLSGRSELAKAYLQRARMEQPDDPQIAHNVALASTLPEAAPPVPPAATHPTEARPAWIEHMGPREYKLVFAADVAAPVPTPAPTPAPSRHAATERPAPERLAAVQTVQLEVSNGTGRTGMARRFAGWINGSEGRRARLTNAGHFAHPATTIQYTAAADGAARQLAARLPLAARLERVTGPGALVRVVLGADLLGFDSQLLRLALRPATSREG